MNKCSHDYNWDHQRTINGKQYGLCTRCHELVRIEHQGWKSCGDTIGYAGVTVSAQERAKYLRVE